MALKTIGLLGGSFDPVHLAHTALAVAALHELCLDEVQLLPAGQPWQRTPLAASPAQRLAMLEIAIRDTPGLQINPVEINRGGQTYTVETLRQLPVGPKYVWILGADQLANFCTWNSWQEIVSLVTLAVAQRPGVQASVPAPLHELLQTLHQSLLQIPFAPLPISASDIRERLTAGQPVKGLLDPEVAQYIQRQGLYQPPKSPTTTL